MAQLSGQDVRLQVSPILALPRELRDRIYHYALTESRGVFFYDDFAIQLAYLDETVKWTSDMTWKWLYVCKQLFVEAKEQCSRGGIFATNISLWLNEGLIRFRNLHALKLKEWSVFDPKHVRSLSTSLQVRHCCNRFPPTHQWYGLSRYEMVPPGALPYTAHSGITMKHLRVRFAFWSRLSWVTRGVDLSALENWYTKFESVSFILEQPIVRNKDLTQDGKRCVLKSLGDDYLDCQDKLLNIALKLTGDGETTDHKGKTICDWIETREATSYQDPEYLWHLDVRTQLKQYPNAPKLKHRGLRAFSHLVKLGQDHDFDWIPAIGGKFTFALVQGSRSDARSYYCRSKDEFLGVENDQVWVIQGRPRKSEVLHDVREVTE